MKRWLANLFIVILLLSLTGCISYKENNRETERDTIVISVLAGQSTSDAGVEAASVTTHAGGSSRIRFCGEAVRRTNGD